MQKPNGKQWYGGQQLLCWRLFWPDGLDFSPPLYCCAAASVTDAGFSNLEAYTKTQSVLTLIFNSKHYSTANASNPISQELLHCHITLPWWKLPMNITYFFLICILFWIEELFLGFLWFCNTILPVLRWSFVQTRTWHLFCGMCLGL